MTLACCIAGLFLSGSAIDAQIDPAVPHTSDSTRFYIDFVQKNPPAEYHARLAARKDARRQLQRSRYTEVLLNVIQSDGLGALFASLKTRLHTEFFQSEEFFFWIIPPDPLFNIPGIPYVEDRSFPDDPWRRD